MLGPEKHHVQQVKISNRIISGDEDKGIVYEADPRHVEILIEQMALQNAKAVTTPGTKEEGTTQEDKDEKLDEQEVSKYRALVARCNYLSPGRPDIAYTVKELARSMSSPSRGNWSQLERMGRYLKGRPSAQQTFRWQVMPRVLKTYSDADWAGCKATR